jgi:uridine kinase
VSRRVERRYAARYLPGQALYRAEARPLAVADVIVDNTDPAAPEVVRW